MTGGLIAALMPRPRVIVFDAYGTLFDVHAAVGRLSDRVGPDAAALSVLWRAKQLEYSWVLALAGAYRDFWDLTEAALEHALAVFPAVDRALRDDLLGAYRTLAAYDEVPGVLHALRGAGHAIAILSNGSPPMLASAVGAAGLAGMFDKVLSVDVLRTYKTAPEAYGLVTEAFGCDAADVVFISSNRWDVAGAAAFGLRPIWLNRAGGPAEYPGLEPLHEIESLKELA